MNGCWSSSDKVKGALVLVLLGTAVIIALAIAFNPDITINKPVDLVKDLDTVCITVLSITMATILAFVAIIETRASKSPTDKFPIIIMVVPILGIFTGLMSLYLSYFSYSFDMGKLLLAVTMELTISSIFGLFLLLIAVHEVSLKKCES